MHTIHVDRLHSQVPRYCTDPGDHRRHRRQLEAILSRGAVAHPSFDRQYRSDGSLWSVTAEMRCGCDFVALVVV